MTGPLDPDRRPEIKTKQIYQCVKCFAEIAFLGRLPMCLRLHLSVTGSPDWVSWSAEGPDCGGRLVWMREEER